MPGGSAVAGRVDVLLHQDLRVEVGDLRAGDEQRVPARRAPRRRPARRWRPSSGSAARERPRPVELAALRRRVRGGHDVVQLQRARGPAARRRAGAVGVLWYGKRRLPARSPAPRGPRPSGSRGTRAARAACRSAAAARRRPASTSSSSPPPLPKMPPTSEAVAIRSASFHGSGPCGRSIAAYSPGSLRRVEPRLGDVLVDARDVVARRRAGSAARRRRGSPAAAWPGARGRPRCRARPPTARRPSRRSSRRRSSTAARGRRGAARP